MILIFMIQLGIMPINQFQIWDYDRHPAYKNQMENYIELDFEFVIRDIFFVGGNINTIFFQDKINNYVPVEMEYLFKAGFRWQGFEIGFNHFCQHPVITGMSWANILSQNEGGYEKIYIQYEGEIKLWDKKKIK
jgi:hypothetical protein